MNRFWKGLVVASSIVAASVGSAWAEWPEKPIDLVISFEPGGGMDQTMLPLKPLLEERLGQPVLMNYKPGAGGRIGFETVFMKGDDGYTIGALSEPHFTNSTIFDTPAYKHGDLTPVGLVSRDVPIWFVRKDSPIKDLKDLIAEAKKRPGEVTVATGSFTGEQYLSLAILEKQAGIQFRAVNVKGGAAVMTNVVGGHFDLGISRPASILGIKDEIRGIALLAAGRTPLFPDTATFDEQLPDMPPIPHFSSSRGLMVTTKWAKENPESFRKLEAAFKDAVESPEFKEAMDRMGLEVEWVSADDAAAELAQTAEEMVKYKDLVEAATHR